MRWHSTDYLQQESNRKGKFVHRGFWLHDVPRLMLWCRIFGHRPVVDGVGPAGPGLRASRWVVCDRCGVRPDPQGSLGPDGWQVGQRYDGPYAGAEMNDPLMRALLGPGNTVIKGGMHLPGRWPAKPTGTLGGELVLGKTFGVFAAEVEVGCAGSEHTLAGHVRVWPFGALYLNSERHGAWLQRRFNSTGYDDRVINLSVDGWAIRWQIWAKADFWSRSDPWWMHGRVSLDLVEKVFGRKRFSYEDVGEPRTSMVELADDETHEVTLQLQRQRLGRPRLERRARYAWIVEWTAVSKDGIPTGAGRGTYSASVEVSEAAVSGGTWDIRACEAVAERIAQDRARYGYRDRKGAS